MGTWSAALVGWVSAATAGVTVVTVLAATGNLPSVASWSPNPHPSVVPKASAQAVPPAPVAAPEPPRVEAPAPVELVAVAAPAAAPPAPVVLGRIQLPRTVKALPVEDGGLVSPVILEHVPTAQDRTVRISIGVVTSGTPTVVVERDLPLAAAPAGGAATSWGNKAGSTVTVTPPTTQTAAADVADDVAVEGTSGEPAPMNAPLVDGPVVVVGTLVPNA